MEDPRESQRQAVRSLMLPAAVVAGLAMGSALVTAAVLKYRGDQIEARVPPGPSAPAATTGQSQPGAATDPSQPTSAKDQSKEQSKDQSPSPAQSKKESAAPSK